MPLSTSLGTDGYKVFARTEEFAEACTYKPFQDMGEAAKDDRPINCQVIRGEIEDNEVFEVHVANNSTYGISGTELNLGNDEISFPPMDGRTAVDKTIQKVTEQDAGMMVLLCQ